MTNEATKGEGGQRSSRGRERPKSRMARVRRIAIEILILLAVFFTIRAYQQRDVVHGEAPPLEGQNLIGEVRSLSELRGEPVVLHFWATWCGVCRAMEGNVEALVERAPDRVLRIASGSGDRAQVAAFLEARGGARAPETILLDPEGRLSRAYGVSAFPTTFFLDDEGKIQHIEVGYTTTLGLLARLWWTDL